MERDKERRKRNRYHRNTFNKYPQKRGKERIYIYAKPDPVSVQKTHTLSLAHINTHVYNELQVFLTAEKKEKCKQNRSPSLAVPLVSLHVWNSAHRLLWHWSRTWQWPPWQRLRAPWRVAHVLEEGMLRFSICWIKHKRKKKKKTKQTKTCFIIIYCFIYI